MRVFRIVGLYALLVLFGTSLWAQGTAQISGIVKDDTGAVLPGVTITVTHADTAFTRTVVTNEAGAYAMPNFLGRQTGLGLADFVIGRLDRLDHGAPSTLDMNQWYLGLFGQDSWRMTDRVTLNVGLRWELWPGANLRRIQAARSDNASSVAPGTRSSRLSSLCQGEKGMSAGERAGETDVA